MDLSIEVRWLATILLIVTILLIGTATLYFSKVQEINQLTKQYNKSLEQIEIYCDLNFTEINNKIFEETINPKTNELLISNS